MFSATGRVITFHGFLKAYVEGSDDPDTESDDTQTRLPDVAEGDSVSAAAIRAAGPRDEAAGEVHRGDARQGARGAGDRSPVDVRLDHRHDPQPRLRLQEGHRAGPGVAGVLRGAAARGALLAAGLLRVHRRHGGRPRRDRRRPAQPRTPSWPSSTSAPATTRGCRSSSATSGDIDARELATFPIGEGINLRVGRYGPYVEDEDGDRGNVPEDLPPDELTVEKAKELLANPAGAERELGTDPESGLTVVAKNGRYGPYVTEVLPEDAPKSQKPRTSSLFKIDVVDTVTLEDALRLLTLPRVVGVDPESGDEITAQNGRYGPYLKKGTDSRSIDDEEQLLTITLEEALAIYAQPKRAAGPPRNPGPRARRRPGHRREDHREGGPVRRLRHRRRVQRHDPAVRGRGDDHPRAGGRAARRAARQGPGEEVAAKKTAKKSTAKKTTAKKTATKKTTTKKAAAKKS